MTQAPTNTTSTMGPEVKPDADRALVPGPLGRVLAKPYAWEIARRNRAFDQGRGVVTFDRPVISVGNLSVGGTGKTPMVERLVRLLREHGHDPAIAMRGYGADKAGRSDEAELYREAFDDLPIVAQARRVEGLIGLFGTERGERVDCILLDDGFQHRRIARQFDLVTVDATHDPFVSALIPAGRLREPVESLARATHIVVTHAERVGSGEVERLAARLEAIGDTPCAVSSHEWTDLRVREGEAIRDEPVSWMRGRRVVVCCAIGRPDAFLAQVGASGGEVVGQVVLRDHDPFAIPTIDRVCRTLRDSGASALVVTAKDWTKLAGMPIAWPAPVVVPRLEIGFRAGWDRLGSDILACAGHEPE